MICMGLKCFPSRRVTEEVETPAGAEQEGQKVEELSCFVLSFPSLKSRS